MLLVSRLQRLLPFYYGWVIVGASGTAVFARMAPAITTLSIFIYPLSQEFGWSRTLISDGHCRRNHRFGAVACHWLVHRPLRFPPRPLWLARWCSGRP